ncbi:hypothetical protein RchiOBHm_Chr5g0014861 [Rosa chinensis]|uniref:Uncharacterized protein n=1 Tax=Rosa chinensis TaxID=74649 RepID=A0A2P6Q5U2_ROSCH|nr:hypothetical protein RchiOBHm_Chr5g0014861 [Rosa chinensis]
MQSLAVCVSCFVIYVASQMDVANVIKWKDGLLFSSFVIYVAVHTTGVQSAHAGLHLVLLQWTLLIKPLVQSCVKCFGPLF